MNLNYLDNTTNESSEEFNSGQFLSFMLDEIKTGNVLLFRTLHKLKVRGLTHFFSAVVHFAENFSFYVDKQLNHLLMDSINK